MKLLETTIYGFGKFYQKTFSFQDGIHVLYGSNEAGKSTLHTFLGCMLFGLERGRGRAAKNDVYSHYLPWDHDGTFGGSLTLESDDEICRIERNFRADHRSCTLTTPSQGRIICPDNTLPERYYEGLQESLYYNTISVRQLGCATDVSLAEELSKRLTDVHQTGSDAINYPAAVAWLKAEKKRLESSLDSSLEAKIQKKKDTIAVLTNQLDNESFQDEKEALEEQMDDCMELLASCGTAKEPVSEDIQTQYSASHKKGSVWFLLTLLAVGIAGVLWKKELIMGAGLAGIAGVLFGILGIINLCRRQKSHLAEDICDESLSEEDLWDRDDSDHYDGNDDYPNPEMQRLRLHMQELQKRYQALNRQEWEHDKRLEQLQEMEEDLEALQETYRVQENTRTEIQAVNLALTTLQSLSGQMRDSFGPHLNASMSQILNGLTGGTYDEVYVDGQLNVSVRTGSHTVPLYTLSRGTMEQVYLAMRLAVIDLLFPQGGMPLLLDDCFLAYDDERLQHTLEWLAENYSGQVFLFTCQKREAEILKRERIPFTWIELI